VVYLRFVFSFRAPSPTSLSTLSLHDALPIFILMWRRRDCRSCMPSIIRAVRIEIKDLLMIVKGIKRVASSAIYFAYPNKRAKLCPQKPDHHGLLRRHVFFIIAWYRHATKIHVRYS